MGGGGGTSTSAATLYPQIGPILTSAGNQIQSLNNTLPLTAFTNYNPQQMPGLQPYQTAALQYIAGMTQPVSGIQALMDTAAPVGQTAQSIMNLSGTNAVAPFMGPLAGISESLFNSSSDPGSMQGKQAALDALAQSGRVGQVNLSGAPSSFENRVDFSSLRSPGGSAQAPTPVSLSLAAPPSASSGAFNPGSGGGDGSGGGGFDPASLSMPDLNPVFAGRSISQLPQGVLESLNRQYGSIETPLNFATPANGGDIPQSVLEGLNRKYGQVEDFVPERDLQPSELDYLNRTYGGYANAPQQTQQNLARDWGHVSTVTAADLPKNVLEDLNRQYAHVEPVTPSQIPQSTLNSLNLQYGPLIDASGNIALGSSSTPTPSNMQAPSTGYPEWQGGSLFDYLAYLSAKKQAGYA